MNLSYLLQAWNLSVHKQTTLSLRRVVAPVVEAMERRVLLSAGVVLGAGGILTVTGTSNGDTINVEIAGAPSPSGTVKVTFNGAVSSFSAAAVSKIHVYGLGGSDHIVLEGSDNAASANGPSIHSSVYGGGGNDYIEDDVQWHGYFGNTDSLDGGAGDDMLVLLDPASGIFTLNGGDGNDTFLDQSEQDANAVMYGGKGNDTFLWYEDDFITCYGGGGNDTINTGPAALGGPLTINLNRGGGVSEFTDDGGVSFPAGDVNNAVVPPGGGWSSVQVTGNNAGDSINVNGGGMAGSITVTGGSGNDVITATDAANISVLGGGGNDRINATSATSIFADGGAGNDFFHASQADTATLNGGDGNDKLTIDGTVQEAWLNGGAGNDLLTSYATRTHYSGGSGTDAVDFTKRTDNLAVYLDGSKLSGDAAKPTDTFDGTVERVFGGSGNDYIVATKAGGDALFGFGGNDTLVAQGGIDALWGGDGNDTFFAKDGGYTYIVGGSGTDTAYADRNDTLVSIESVHF